MATFATLTSDWATTNDYISADQYNKLVTDIATVLDKRGYTANSRPANVTQGGTVEFSDIIALRNYVSNVINYKNGSNDSDANFPYDGQTSVPMAKLYNEVRQVLVDMNGNAGCIHCTNSCRQGCAANCYTSRDVSCENGTCSGRCKSSECSGICSNAS